MAITVNGEPVDQELINQEFSQIKAYHEQRSQVSCCERDDEFLAQAKENIIGRILLNQKAQSSIPDLSQTELDEAVEQLKQDYGGEEQFFAQAGIQPNDMDFVREQVAINGKVDRLVQQICGNPDEIPTDALEQYYQDHIEAYTSEPRVKAMHIYKSLRQTEDKEALFRECCRIRESLVGGADFATTAKEFSDKPEEEVDLGWFKRGELMDEFEFVTFSMEVDEISPVFTSYHGFHIAKVTDKEPAVAQPLDAIRDKVTEDYRLEIQNQDLKKYVETLRQEADIQESEDKEESEDV